MRQRRIKDIDTKIEKYEEYIVPDPAEQKGKWREYFGEDNSDKKLFVEIGCGKGRFIVDSAKANPDGLYVAVEGFSSVIYRALEKIDKDQIANIACVKEFVFDLGNWFEEDEIDGLFLNFSDPWPKKKNAKRRLTYRDRLEQYAKAIKPGGFLRFKTDNDGLFEFTLEELDLVIDRCGFEIEAMTRDLHSSEWAVTSPMTEYEAKFAGTGKNINYLALRKL